MADIRISSITKHFGAFHALKGVDLPVRDQEFMVLLGASGCGKSTLLRIIAGLESADAGTVHVGGERIDHLQAKDRGLAMVFQNYAVFPHLTVFENIAFGLRMQRCPDAELRQRVQRVAELVHLEALLQRYSGQLSGGQRQRVALARALAVAPPVVLMDEPLSNLDALLRLEMRAELKTILGHSRTTTIYVTHDQVEAMSLADRIAIMDQGVIVQCDTPLEIYRNPATTFVAGFIGNPPMNFVPAVAVQDGVFEAQGLRLDGPRGHARLTLGVRPEDLQVTAEANEAGASGFGIDIAVVEPLGAHTLVTAFIDAGAGEPRRVFRAALDSAMSCHAGQSLRLRPTLSRVRWYDDAGRLVPHGLASQQED
jgi:multiple sugar transport system ATP-binding protein